MSISITCPQCRKQHIAPDSLAGRAAKCRCGAVIQIPAAVSSAQPVALSLFDEVSQADVDRIQNRQPTKAAEPAHANPYQSPAALQYLASAGSVRGNGSGRSTPWLKWSYVLAGVWSIVVVVVGGIGFANIVNDNQATPQEQTARAEEFGHGLAMFAMIGWGPAAFLTGRWLMTKMAA